MCWYFIIQIIPNSNRKILIWNKFVFLLSCWWERWAYFSGHNFNLFLVNHVVVPFLFFFVVVVRRCRPSPVVVAAAIFLADFCWCVYVFLILIFWMVKFNIFRYDVIAASSTWLLEEEVSILICLPILFFVL